MRARLRIAIVALVAAIVIAASSLHLHDVIGETLEDAGERGRMIAEQVSTHLPDVLNRQAGTVSTARVEDLKALWRRTLESSSEIQRLLQKAMVRSNAVVDVAVLDMTGHVLTAADPTRIGKPASPARSWRDWQDRNLVSRVLDLYSSRTDLVLNAPLGLSASGEPLMVVRVALSPVLLRDLIRPKLLNLAAVSLISLSLSAFLAILVSKLVGDSLDRLGHKIDLIAQGDLQSVQRDRFHSPELVNLELKLWWLGRQYTGARADVMQMRSNVEQMLRKMEEAILLFGPDGRVQLAGEAAQQLLAKSRPQLIGRSIEDIFPAWTSVGAVIGAAIRARASVREQQVPLERPNMPTVRVVLNVEPILYDEPGAHGVLVTLRDAETRQQLQADLDTVRRLSAIGRITSGVAHEIKNPLNAMTLHLEIAGAKLAAGHDCTPELAIVKEQLLRLDRVVKALLDFTRPVDVELKECDLWAIAADTVSQLHPQASGMGVELFCDGEPVAAPVLADPDLLKQALLNVVVNGMEAAGNGGVVRIRIDKGTREHALLVEDSGPGIPAEIRDKIFNLYFTTKKAGTGVGLAVSYRIMQMHGGAIEVDSEVGRGSLFRLTLPARQPRTAAA